MTEMRDLIERLASALEGNALSGSGTTDWLSSPAYVWDGSARAVDQIEAPRIENLRGIDKQKQAVVQNTSRLASGHAAHDVLLWGSRGMGKSALVRASVVAAQAESGSIALVQVAPDALSSLTKLFRLLGQADRNFLVYIDDLGFAGTSTFGARSRPR